MNYALILAAGSSSRFGENKIFAPLWGMTVIEHVLILCEATTRINSVHVACRAGDKTRIEELCTKRLTKPFTIIVGGNTRFETSLKLTRHVYDKNHITKRDIFVMLNGANPLSSEDEIGRCIKACVRGVVGAGVGRPVASSLKKIVAEIGNGSFLVEDDIPRINVFEMETPQAVNALEYNEIVELIDTLGKTQKVFTDDIAVVQFTGKKTVVVLANEYNRKITSKADLDMLNGLITAIGLGEDSHTLIESQKPLVLGGVKIESEFAFDADSDGDVVVHSIANALSSALGGGSLGTFATAMCEDGITDSAQYLKVIMKKSKKVFLRVAHLSLSLEGSYPKIDVHAAAMRDSLSKILELPVERIGITATTGKNHSEFGKGKALKCIASILLRHA